MKYISLVAFFILLFTGCSQKEELVVKTKPVNFQQIDGFYDDDLDKALMVFKKACKKSSRKKFFSYVCEKSNDYKDGEKFFTKYFEPKILYSDDSEEGLITGYYEPLLKGSLVKTEKYKYPIYKVPNDLIRLDKKTKEVMPYADKMFDLFNKSYASLSSFVAITDIQKDYFKKKTFDNDSEKVKICLSMSIFMDGSIQHYKINKTL